MELVFQERELNYLSRVLCETVTQEQTAELIVPDSYPDADRVVDAFATALIRSEECSAGAAGVSGNAQVGVLFVTEDGEIGRLETQIPFSARKEFDTDYDDCTMQCACAVSSVDARMLNSRKVLVRVGVRCTMSVYARQRQTLYDIPEPAATLQLRRTKIPLRLPLELGEKSFVLNEEVEIPGTKPAVERLLKCVYRTEVEEQKLVGSKAVFKGNLIVHALYECPEGKLHSFEAGVPFSQYVDMEQELDDHALSTVLAMTSVETEPDGQMDCRRLLLSANLIAQCTAYGEQEVSLIEDAFCTNAELSPQWAEWKVTGVLDRQNFRETALAQSDAPAGGVVDAWLYTDETIRRREGERMLLELPMSVNVLYVDGEGKLQGRSMRPVANFSTELAEDGGCRLRVTGGGEIFSAAGADGMELRCPVSVELESFAEHRLRCVCGGEITEPPQSAERRPAVILRRTEAEQDVWDIAKAYHTATQAVMEANALTGAVVPADTLLLIPMQ